MEEFRGYEIKVVENNEREYPFKAIGRKGNAEVKHKGASQQQAVDFVKESINIMLVKMEMKHRK